MAKSLILKSALIVCLGLVVGMLPSAQAQITVQYLGEDTVTGGDWRQDVAGGLGPYGDCYYLLPDPQCTGFPEPLVGTPQGAVCEEGNPKIGDVGSKLIRGDDEPLRSFWLTEVLCDDSDCGGEIACGSDFSPCSGGAQWNPCAGGFKATTWDDGDNVTPGGIFPPAVVELEISFEGSTDVAFYTVNACDTCRTQDYILTVGGAAPVTGTFNNLGEGNYLVFRITGLDGSPTTIRFETDRADSDVCPPGTIPNGTANAHVSGVFLSKCEPPEEPECSIGDYVWEDANRDGCQDPDEEDPIEGVEVKLFEDCGDPAEITSTTTNAEGFYEFTGLDCDKEYRVQFGDAGDIYAYTEANSCTDGDPNIPPDEQDSDCGENGFSGCVTFPDPVNDPDNPTIDCGYVCEGKIGDFVFLDENEDGCQDNEPGIPMVDVTLSEDCDNPENSVIATTSTDENGKYVFIDLCPGEYFVEFGNELDNTRPGDCRDTPSGPNDPTKDSNCGDQELQCVELTKDNPEDPTIDCGKIPPPCPLEVTKMAEPDDVMCDSATDGTEGPGDCVVDCRDTGTDGWDTGTDGGVDKCIAQTVTYTITVTNPSNRIVENIMVVDEVLGFMEGPFTLGPGQSREIILPGECIKEDTTNTVVVTVNGEICDTAMAEVTVDPECIDSGTDGY